LEDVETVNELGTQESKQRTNFQLSFELFSQEEVKKEK
jgi:hypothetical protein